MTQPDIIITFHSTMTNQITTTKSVELPFVECNQNEDLVIH